METLETKIHYYRFYIDKPDERRQYEELCARLQSDGRNFFNVLADSRNHPTGEGTETITLELAHVFANQWNSTTSRVFDWYEGIYPNRKLKAGHYLDITPEMRAVREHTLTCGYCGKQVLDSQPHGTFCDRCLGSEYLKETEIFLLRLLPTVENFPKRPELTEAEKAELMPRYIEAQTRSRNALAIEKKAKARRNVEAKHRRESLEVEEEYKGFLWLLDHDINTENCIYYSHTRIFSFGWRGPVSESVKSALLDVLVEFPYEYEIKTQAEKVRR